MGNIILKRIKSSVPVALIKGYILNVVHVNETIWFQRFLCTSN